MILYVDKPSYAYAAMETKDQNIEMLVRKLRERFERYHLPFSLLLQRLAAFEHSAVGLAENNHILQVLKEGSKHV